MMIGMMIGMMMMPFVPSELRTERKLGPLRHQYSMDRGDASDNGRGLGRPLPLEARAAPSHWSETPEDSASPADSCLMGQTPLLPAAASVLSQLSLNR